MIKAIGCGVIVAAPSNAAVANVALKVHSSSNCQVRGLVVFGQNCDESVRFLNPLHRSEAFYTFRKLYSNLSDDSAKERKLKEFAQWLRLDDEDPDISDLARLCPYINMDDSNGRKLFNSLLREASIIFCTLNSSGSNLLRSAVGGAFSTYILDEAGQCTESGEKINMAKAHCERNCCVSPFFSRTAFQSSTSELPSLALNA
jgi:hypothetical protein